jgi:hypothetical protein
MRNTFVIKDKYGNIIRKGHNRVVSTGRQFILSVFKHGVNPLNSGLVSDTSFSLTRVNFINSTDATTDSAKASTENIKKYIEIEPNIIKISDDNISITLQLNGDTNGYAVSCAEVLCQINSETTQLFSRFTFDPIYLNPGESDTITYTLRF